MSLLNEIVKTQEFATLPPVATKILELLEHDDIDFRGLSHIIESDASLTIKLIRVANSPIYAMRTDVTSIQQAISTLGMNRLTNIVLGVSIFSRFMLSLQKNAQGILEKFWWHSSCTGIIAKALTNKLNLNFKENEFIGGLLHDIGKLALLQYDTAKFIKSVELVKAMKIKDVEAEREVFNTDHLEVGYEIAKMWKLPSELRDIIGLHNNPPEAKDNRDIIAVVRFADLLCEMWDAGIFEGYEKLTMKDEEAWITLSNTYPYLKDIDLEVFTFEMEEEFKKSTEFLNAIMQS